MSLLDDFRRVSRGSPCPICERFDWCLLSIEGGDTPVSAICARVESRLAFGAAGWLHRLRDRASRPPAVRTVRLRPTVDHRETAERFAAGARLDPIAEDLGLPVEALRRLRVGWNPDERCSTWPLWDPFGRCVGIVRRFAGGRKLLRPGDRSGLYLPADLPEDLAGERLLVVEGGTDTAAGLALGRWCVGRFSCGTGGDELRHLLTRRKAASVSILADRDAPGVDGAERLRKALVPIVRDLRIVLPPQGTKDLRDWLRAGGTAADLARFEEVAR